MKIKFLSLEAMDKFVENSPYTDNHNLILAGLIGLGEFNVEFRYSSNWNGHYWTIIGETEFVITQSEMYCFEIMEY